MLFLLNKVLFLKTKASRYPIFSQKTEKRLGFPFLKTRSFNFQPFWNNLSQKLGIIYDEFGPLPIRIKKVIALLRTLK